MDRGRGKVRPVPVSQELYQDPLGDDGQGTSVVVTLGGP